ncbi:Complement decay-accelerating factor [Pseudolycoriella hygida]|uniref:Complement decay-accelerating factor n=1 Tax=Pseudolycoriella hygida TaxID=35572 RepID=A0A9Q0S1U5_9DIPT|nr:Complement decay-accelerating factor [Pseudolycoriella hygida]
MDQYSIEKNLARIKEQPEQRTRQEFYPGLSINVGSVHTNCFRPPHIENGSTKPLVEDEGDELVSVTYVCNDGFTLQGEAELLCMLETDEWQGEPPTCNPGTTKL